MSRLGLGCACLVLLYILIYSPPRLDFLAKSFLEMDAGHAFAIVNKILVDEFLTHDKSLAQEVDQIMKYACAAQLAAKNSKAKTQSVVPVIAVLRKFVSKPKNAALGEVSVQKEEIVDAFIA